MEGGGCPPFVLLHFTLWLVGDTCDSDKNLPVWRGDGKQARYKELLESLCHPPVGFAFLHYSMALIMITGIYNGPALEPSPHDCMIAAAICLEDVEAERAADDLSLAGLAAGVGKPTK
ncbi:hypothetical protein THAOC_01773 [Thalassiosira oceanica]|uniref:Uncharacterized protein n=1 Tax=Thalassiosira oceanica TaxID=159749 RepID=K0TCJ6_THAOC|nr:hypothetical protein THAOC_01773 [Thalassiosira oceanica]|eukprot:EJK76463.1 hypothetical protein THAOC_01773 [Thalassiosira oceanica]